PANGPTVFSRLIGQDQVHARRLVPLRPRRGRLEGFDIGSNEVAVAVLDEGVGQLVLQRIRVFDIADRTADPLNIGSDPFVALAEIDVGKNGAGEPDLTGFDCGDVDHGNVAADYRRKLHQPALVQLFRLERHVRGAEIHGLVLDLPDAAAGADRLVVEVVACS